MTNTQAEIKEGYSLAMVPFFNRTDNWLDFFNDIETFLIMGSQLNWLKDHKNTPAIPLTK